MPAATTRTAPCPVGSSVAVRVMMRAAEWNRASGNALAHRVEGVAAGPGDDERVSVGDDPLGDGRGLRGRLAGPENDLRTALAHAPVMIDPREAEILERRPPQQVENARLRLLQVERAALEVGQDRAHVFGVHVCSRRSQCKAVSLTWRRQDCTVAANVVAGRPGGRAVFRGADRPQRLRCAPGVPAVPLRRAAGVPAPGRPPGTRGRRRRASRCSFPSSTRRTSSSG